VAVAGSVHDVGGGLADVSVAGTRVTYAWTAPYLDRAARYVLVCRATKIVATTGTYPRTGHMGGKTGGRCNVTITRLDDGSLLGRLPAREFRADFSDGGPGGADSFDLRLETVPYVRPTPQLVSGDVSVS
jgi:hypothetical protein